MPRQQQKLSARVNKNNLRRCGTPVSVQCLCGSEPTAQRCTNTDRQPHSLLRTHVHRLHAPFRDVFPRFGVFHPLSCLICRTSQSTGFSSNRARMSVTASSKYRASQSVASIPCVQATQNTNTHDSRSQRTRPRTPGAQRAAQRSKAVVPPPLSVCASTNANCARATTYKQHNTTQRSPAARATSWPKVHRSHKRGPEDLCDAA